MKLKILIFFGVSIIFSSCFEAPEFPNTPKIEFKEVIFKDIGTNSDPDSLLIILNFQDGDGDLGLSTNESQSPYNQKNYFSNKTGLLFDFKNEDIEDLLTFSDTSEIDSLPPFSGNAQCLNWDTNPEIFFLDGTQLDDTVYFQFNPRYHNIFVDFFLDKGTGFEQFVWRLEIDCSTNFDGRFPRLSSETKSKALEGTIKYGMLSVGFKSIFQDNPIKLKITIVDRNGNFSNTVETPPFRLSEID